MNPSSMPPTWEKVRAALASGDRADINAAHRYLQDDADSSFLPHLHALVAERETPAETRFSAAAGIVRLEGSTQFRYVIETLAELRHTVEASGEHDAPAYEAFLDALWELIASNPVETQRILGDLVREPRTDLRAFATFLYGNSDGPVTPLLQLLHDADPFVRLTAVSAASGFAHDTQTVPAIISKLGDGDKNVRLMATYVLSGLGDRLAVPALKEAATSDSSKAVRDAAAHARRRLDGTQRFWRWLLVALVVLGIALLAQAFLS